MSALALGAPGALLVPEEVVACREVFAEYDINSNGLIDVKELENAMAQLGMELPQDHLKKLKASLEEDNTKALDLQTFMQLMSQQKPHMLLPLTHTQLAWVGLDGAEDYSGTVSVQALKEKLEKLGAELEDMDTFLQERGQNSANSVLNWEDFQALLDD